MASEYSTIVDELIEDFTAAKLALEDAAGADLKEKQKIFETMYFEISNFCKSQLPQPTTR